jgi:hypothetical protein
MGNFVTFSVQKIENQCAERTLIGSREFAVLPPVHPNSGQFRSDREVSRDVSLSKMLPPHSLSESLGEETGMPVVSGLNTIRIEYRQANPNP